jgi:transposase
MDYADPGASYYEERYRQRVLANLQRRAKVSARIGKAKAVTATARKIAVLFYNAVRHGMDYADPGASYYEERYRERVLANLQRRAKALGYILQPTEIKVVSTAVS